MASGNLMIAIEHGHLQLIDLSKMGMFHRYVSLPDGRGLKCLAGRLDAKLEVIEQSNMASRASH